LTPESDGGIEFITQAEGKKVEPKIY